MRCHEVRHPWAPRLASRPRSVAARGFTFAEMAVAVTIVAVLTAVAMPSLRDFVGGRAVDAQAQELVTTLRLARSEAMKRGAEVSVCSGVNLETSGTTCASSTAWAPGWLAFVDYDTNGAMGGNDFAVRVHTGQAGVKTVTASAKSVTMARTGFLLLIDGAAVGANATVSFVLKPLSGSDQAARTVCLNKQGRVSVSRGVITCV